MVKGMFWQRYGQTCVVRFTNWQHSPILGDTSDIQLPSIILFQWLPGCLATGTDADAVARNTTTALSFLFNGPIGFRIMRNSAYEEIGWQHKLVDGCDSQLDNFFASGVWIYMHLVINMSTNLIDGDTGMETTPVEQQTPAQPIDTEEWFSFAMFFKIWITSFFKGFTALPYATLDAVHGAGRGDPLIDTGFAVRLLCGARDHARLAEYMKNEFLLKGCCPETSDMDPRLFDSPVNSLIFDPYSDITFPAYILALAESSFASADVRLLRPGSGTSGSLSGILRLVDADSTFLDPMTCSTCRSMRRWHRQHY
jgi:hypothetical protein